MARAGHPPTSEARARPRHAGSPHLPGIGVARLGDAETPLASPKTQHADRSVRLAEDTRQVSQHQVGDTLDPRTRVTTTRPPTASIGPTRLDNKVATDETTEYRCRKARHRTGSRQARPSNRKDQWAGRRPVRRASVDGTGPLASLLARAVASEPNRRAPPTDTDPPHQPGSRAAHHRFRLHPVTESRQARPSNREHQWAGRRPVRRASVDGTGPLASLLARAVASEPNRRAPPNTRHTNRGHARLTTDSDSTTGFSTSSTTEKGSRQTRPLKGARNDQRRGDLDKLDRRTASINGRGGVRFGERAWMGLAPSRACSRGRLRANRTGEPRP